MSMILEPLSVPVKASPTATDVISHDIIDIDGLLSYRDRCLLLEYRTLSMSMGKSSTETMRLPLEELDEIIVRKQFFKQTIVIRPREMSRLEGMPGTQAHTLELKVDRKYQEQGERFVSMVALELAELRLDRLAPELSMPGPVPSVGAAPEQRREGGAPPELSAQSADERRAVAATLRRINDTWLDGRADDLASFFHENIVLAGPGAAGRTEGRAAAVAGFAAFAGSTRVVMYRESESHVDLVGDTAVATVAFEMIYERDGARYRSAGRDVWVFVRHAECWLAIWRTMTDLREEKVG